MFATRASRRRVGLYFGLFAVTLMLLATSGTGPMRELQRAVGFAFAPIQGVLSGATRGFTSIFDAITEIDRLRRDNQALQAENQQLSVENRQLQEVKIQNEQLSKLLGVQGSLDYKTVAAVVIGRQYSQQERVITIDHGTGDGIEEHDVVVAGGGALVGFVLDAEPDYSRVLLLSDTRSTVTGLIESSRATGTVVGQLGGTLVMQQIDATERVNLGDQVVTAGIDLGNGTRSQFPKGLLIGRIVDVQRDPNAVVQTGILEPAADLDKLEYVLVITDYHGGFPPVPAASGEPGPFDTPAPSGTAPAPSESPIVLPTPTLPPGPP